MTGLFFFGGGVVFSINYSVCSGVIYGPKVNLVDYIVNLIDLIFLAIFTLLNLKNMSLDQQLRDTECLKAQSWGKIISYLKRQFDQWATERLNQHGYKSFKMAYMPVLMNIKVDGTNNNELARNARVTKQAMSKVAKELHELGYIKTKVDPNDKRSTIFMLTDRGKKLVLEARMAVKGLMDEYREVFGHEDYDRTIQLLLKIIDYTDEKLGEDGK